jgi:hypothetical protein
VAADREEADVYPKRGFSIAPADFSAAAKRFGMAADVLAALAERVLVEAEAYGFPRGHGHGHDPVHSHAHAPASPHDERAYADGMRRSASLSTECVRRLRELESNASGVAVAYQRTEEAVAGRFR